MAPIRRFHAAREKRQPAKRLKKRWGLLFRVSFYVFAVVFAFSTIELARCSYQSAQEENAFKALAASTVEARHASGAPERREERNGESDAGNDAESAASQQSTQYLALYEQNPDFAGWLHMENTGVDYPVMLTPDEPEYYLRRAFDGTPAQSGTPFIGKNGTPDSDVFIIYGHNMKNDTMFGTLEAYAKESFRDENPCFDFTTIAEYRKYEVFAAIETRILFEEETGYRYYEQAGNLSETEFAELVDWLMANALYDTGIVPEYGEQIVLLSTCSYHEENGRFLIAARRLS